MLLWVLSFASLRTQVSQNGVNAVFVNGTHRCSADSHTDKAVFRRYPKAMPLQIRQKAAFSSVIRVGNIIPDLRTFARNLAYSRHTSPLFNP